MKKYWKLNWRRRIVALQDMFDGRVRKGDVGAEIPENVSIIGNQMSPLWIGPDTTFGEDVVIRTGTFIGGHCEINDLVEIGYGCIIGCGVRIHHQTTIQTHVIIGEYAYIGNNVKIDSSCKLGRVNIDYDAKLESGVIARDYAYIGKKTVVKQNAQISDFASVGDNCVIESGAVIGHDAKVSDDATIDVGFRLAARVRVPENAKLNTNTSVTFGNLGISGRNLMLFIHDSEVLVSVGCQCGITFDEFNKRVYGSIDTQEESANQYKDKIAILTCAKIHLERKIIPKPR